MIRKFFSIYNAFLGDKVIVQYHLELLHGLECNIVILHRGIARLHRDTV